MKNKNKHKKIKINKLAKVNQLKNINNKNYRVKKATSL